LLLTIIIIIITISLDTILYNIIYHLSSYYYLFYCSRDDQIFLDSFREFLHEYVPSYGNSSRLMSHESLPELAANTNTKNTPHNHNHNSNSQRKPNRSSHRRENNNNNNNNNNPRY
jgi:hypothetical protein